jgi:hypothetical protein
MSGYVNCYGQPLDVQAMEQADRVARMRHEKPPRRTPTVPNGYAAPPGGGPLGQTCRSCAHKRSMTNTGAKRWIKCALREATWTHGEATDIRASSPACVRWMQRTSVRQEVAA